MIADGKYASDAEDSGADIVGVDDVINDIKSGKIDFDILLTAPRYMPKLAPIARVSARSAIDRVDSGTQEVNALSP